MLKTYNQSKTLTLHPYFCVNLHTPSLEEQQKILKDWVIYMNYDIDVEISTMEFKDISKTNNNSYWSGLGRLLKSFSSPDIDGVILYDLAFLPVKRAINLLKFLKLYKKSLFIVKSKSIYSITPSNSFFEVLSDVILEIENRKFINKSSGLLNSKTRIGRPPKIKVVEGF